MEWSDHAMILSNRAHGEAHSIARLFTAEHGAVAALVHGGQGRSKSAIVQAGNGVHATWRGKSESQLGHFELELTEPRAATAMADRNALMGMTAVTNILHTVLPEGNAYPNLFAATSTLLDFLDEKAIWPILLAKWELGLLEELGFGLTLDRCVASGQLLEDGAELTFVSPKSGGAVSYKSGMPYKDKLLPLPPFLIGMGEPSLGDVKAALNLTAYFLRDRLLGPAGFDLPDARDRLVSRTGR